MGFGLFGKLPQKRDFVAQNISNEILAPLETWLQSAVAASRSELGRSWEELYLIAPIWRFWIGQDILGAACAGALMPSVDGIGRFFPLMAIYICEPAQAMPPPPYASQDKWFAGIEQRLLQVLDEGAEITLDQLLAGLPAPAMEPSVQDQKREIFKGGPLWRGAPDTDTPSFLATIFEDDYRDVARARSFWWTPATEDRGPVVHTKAGLPDAYFHTRMLRLAAD